MHRSLDSRHRPDIQGLRAVAALLVCVYHVWLGRVSGGVDAFFVVSGFLITGTLLRQIDMTGRVQPRAFWSRLVRRLLPTAMFVLFAIVLVSFVRLPRSLWENAIAQTLAAALYLNNWQLAFDAADYLEQAHLATPVQHYWALSIQAQVYLLWPLLLLLVARVTRSRLAFRPALGGVLVLVALASLAYSVVATRANQPFAYFDTGTRLWEFCAGALFALLPAERLPRAAREVGGWLGLAGLLACGFVLEPRAFPGYATVWPVACAVLILTAGAGRPTGAARALSLPPLVRLGAISYGLYLWHWPVLVFYRWTTHQSKLGALEGVAVIAASIVLAAATAWLLRPRARAVNAVRPPAPPRATRVAIAALAPVIVVGAAWGGVFLVQQRHDAVPVVSGDPAYPGGAAGIVRAASGAQAGTEFRPGLLAATRDLPAPYLDGCYRPDPDWQRERCVYGDRTATRTLAVVGGSHPVHWLPALAALARANSWRIVVYTKHNCVFGTAGADVPIDRWCAEWNARTLELLLQDRPAVVFTTATRDAGAAERVPLAFVDRWRRLAEAGIRVVAIRDTPRLPVWIPECIDLKGREHPDCNPARERVLASVDPTRALRDVPANVRFVDMSDYFCDERSCPPIVGNVLVYRDDSHITATYARSLAPALAARLADALPGGWLADAAAVAQR